MMTNLDPEQLQRMTAGAGGFAIALMGGPYALALFGGLVAVGALVVTAALPAFRKAD